MALRVKKCICLVAGTQVCRAGKYKHPNTDSHECVCPKTSTDTCLTKDHHICVCRSKILNRRRDKCRSENPHDCICVISPADCLGRNCACICYKPTYSKAMREMCRSKIHDCLCRRPDLGRCRLIQSDEDNKQHKCVCNFADLWMNCRAPRGQHACICRNGYLQMTADRCRARKHKCSCFYCPQQCLYEKRHHCVCDEYNSAYSDARCLCSNHNCICLNVGPAVCLAKQHFRKFCKLQTVGLCNRHESCGKILYCMSSDDCYQWASERRVFVSSYLHHDTYYVDGRKEHSHFDCLPRDQSYCHVAQFVCLALPELMVSVVYHRLVGFIEP